MVINGIRPFFFMDHNKVEDITYLDFDLDVIYEETGMLSLGVTISM